MTVDDGAGASGPTVGVVVPAYKVAEFIEATLRSVQAQTVTDFECVVVDDGSPDDSGDRAEKMAATDPRIRVVRQENRGLSGARNAGIANLSASVRYVAFLDADDLWCDDALEKLVAPLEADPAAVGSYGYAEMCDEHDVPVQEGLQSGRQRDRKRLAGMRVRRVGEHEVADFDEIVFANPVWPPAVALHRRDVVDRIGAFDVGLKQVEDADFLIRMVRHGHYVPVASQVAWYRQHSSQMTGRRAEFWWSHDVVRRKSWESPLNSPDQRRSVARSWRMAQFRRIARCTQRLGSAALGRRWGDAGRLSKGWVVLVGQLARPGPPVARMEHVVWAGRDV